MRTTVGGQTPTWIVVENLELAESNPSLRTEAHRLSDPIIQAGKATVLKRAFSACLESRRVCWTTIGTVDSTTLA